MFYECILGVTYIGFIQYAGIQDPTLEVGFCSHMVEVAILMDGFDLNEVLANENYIILGLGSDACGQDELDD